MKNPKVKLLASAFLLALSSCQTSETELNELTNKGKIDSPTCITLDNTSYAYKEICSSESYEKPFSIFDWIFPVRIDKEIGQFSSKILEMNNYILEEKDYQEAYDLLNEIKDEILNSGKIRHATDFDWKIKIIDDKVPNAFTFSGGYIYVNRGLFSSLKNTDEMAGIMAHEIIHSDCRHIIKSLGFSAGIQATYFLFEFVIEYLFPAKGEEDQIRNNTLYTYAYGVLNYLIKAQYGQGNEIEADLKGVEVLADGPYSADAFSSFFDREEEPMGLLERVLNFFCSPFRSHPKPEYRVENIREKAKEIGAKKTGTPEVDLRFLRIKELIKKRI